MTHHPCWFVLNAVGLSAIVGCGDLHLADRMDGTTTQAQGGFLTSTSAGSTTQLGGQGGTLSGSAGRPSPLTIAGATTIVVAGGNGGSSATNLGGIPAVGGVAATLGGATTTLGGATTTLGGATTTLGGATTTLGGATTTLGGATTTLGGAAATGGATIGGAAPAGGGVATGGSLNASAGTTASGGAATGGGPTTVPPLGSGGTATGGTATGGTATGGDSTGGRATGGMAGAAGSRCPSPISKPEALLAAEPTPVDSCARVSNVILLAPSYYAYGFTNGEIYVFNPTSSSKVRADSWNTSGVVNTLPRAIVTSMVAPRNNNEWALQAGHASPQGTLHNPWRAASLGRGWSEATVERPGTVMTLTACPFHGGPLSHLELDTPWITQGSLTSGASYVMADTGKFNQHLQLAREYHVTAIEIFTKAEGWLVYVGTEFGEIYVSNLLVGDVTWSDATSSLNTTVTWTKITGASMPKKWITRLAVHPTHPERILAVFASSSGDAVWYSADAGTNWSNRQANLPTAYNASNTAPPILGASFNPIFDGAAYVVTSLTSYHTLDYGGSWTEW